MKNSKKKPVETNGDSNALEDMLQAMLPLVGRIAFPVADLQAIVMLKKRNPLDYIEAYNLCDGEHTLSEIAAAIHVTPGTLSPILAEWKDQGIVYEVTRGNGRFYKRLYRLDFKSSKLSKPRKDAKAESVGTTSEPLHEAPHPTEQTTFDIGADHSSGN